MVSQKQSYDKKTAMSLHARQNINSIKLQVTFDNMDIAYRTELKFLGTYSTENLKWNVQMRSLSP
jgi:hypothetical protein